jgi:ubiquinone/menaquinone biosynthesis C-methylase UbiE
MAHVCSHRHVWTFDNFLRPFIHNPRKIFGPYVSAGMRVLDVGCGAGFAALGLAELVGETGSVLAVDVQPEMLAKVVKRGRKAGLEQRIATHLSAAGEIQVEGLFDFINAFYMVHEVPDKKAFFSQLHACLQPTGHLLVVEPKFHVSKAGFGRMLQTAREQGFKPIGHPKIIASRAVVLMI